MSTGKSTLLEKGMQFIGNQFESLLGSASDKVTGAVDGVVDKANESVNDAVSNQTSWITTLLKAVLGGSLFGGSKTTEDADLPGRVNFSTAVYISNTPTNALSTEVAEKTGGEVVTGDAGDAGKAADEGKVVPAEKKLEYAAKDVTIPQADELYKVADKDIAKNIAENKSESGLVFLPTELRIEGGAAGRGRITIEQRKPTDTEKSFTDSGLADLAGYEGSKDRSMHQTPAVGVYSYALAYAKAFDAQNRYASNGGGIAGTEYFSDTELLKNTQANAHNPLGAEPITSETFKEKMYTQIREYSHASDNALKALTEGESASLSQLKSLLKESENTAGQEKAIGLAQGVLSDIETRLSTIEARNYDADFTEKYNNAVDAISEGFKGGVTQESKTLAEDMVRYLYPELAPLDAATGERTFPVGVDAVHVMQNHLETTKGQPNFQDLVAVSMVVEVARGEGSKSPFGVLSDGWDLATDAATHIFGNKNAEKSFTKEDIEGKADIESGTRRALGLAHAAPDFLYEMAKDETHMSVVLQDMAVLKQLLGHIRGEGEALDLPKIAAQRLAIRLADGESEGFNVGLTSFDSTNPDLAPYTNATTFDKGKADASERLSNGYLKETGMSK